MPTPTTKARNSEGAIWSRIVRPGRKDLALEAAQFILTLDFAARDRQRMHDLVVKNQEGALSPAEDEEIDHFIARKHGGLTEASNLALACFYCNSFKGSNIGGMDRVTGRFVQLFNPRRHPRKRHFRWEGTVLVGRTPIGRVTAGVLAINN